MSGNIADVSNILQVKSEALYIVYEAANFPTLYKQVLYLSYTSSVPSLPDFSDQARPSLCVPESQV